MKVVPLVAAHLQKLRLQSAQQGLSCLLRDPDYSAMLISAGPAFAGLAGDQVVGCAGVVRLSAHRGHAWALLSANARGQFPAIHKAVSRFLASNELRRVETAVDCGFSAGHRWARLLGFTHEGRMRGYAPDGGDADLYARVRN